MTIKKKQNILILNQGFEKSRKGGEKEKEEEENLHARRIVGFDINKVICIDNGYETVFTNRSKERIEEITRSGIFQRKGGKSKYLNLRNPICENENKITKQQETEKKTE